MALQPLWAALLVLLLVALLHKVLSALVWRPLYIQKSLRSQGIRGPPYKFLFGNLKEFSALTKAARASPMPHITHNILPRVMPHYTAWAAQYGVPLLYSLGYKPRITIPDPELCKEILTNKFGHFQKPGVRLELEDLVGKGLVVLEGEKWAQHRRVVNPAFFMEKLKEMVPTIANLANGMLEKWQSQLQEAGECKEMDACEEFKTLTADIIAHTAFGSSYAEGKQVFKLQYEQQLLFTKLGGLVYIPGSRFIPTPKNRFRWSINNQIKRTLEEIIQKRLSSSSECRKDMYGSDLLGLMLSAYREEVQGNQRNSKMSLQEIIAECKTFFFAGHETTSSLLTWTIMLLAIHSEWQERAREEVFHLFGTGPPNADSLNHLKIVGMILYESLRLYPPAVGVFREAAKDTNLGDLSIPGGTSIFVPILPLHVDPKLWGPDALEFDPQRFGDGVLKACKHSLAFLPFGSGPRICVGQNFAIMEAKIVLCMILQRFRFRLSPAYKHAPTIVLTLQPEHGMQIILERVET
eukprot:c13695_g1_i1 orf=197-1762(+)